MWWIVDCSGLLACRIGGKVYVNECGLFGWGGWEGA